MSEVKHNPAFQAAVALLLEEQEKKCASHTLCYLLVLGKKGCLNSACYVPQKQSLVRPQLEQSCFSLSCERELWGLLVCKLFNNQGFVAQEWPSILNKGGREVQPLAAASALVGIVPLLILFLSPPLIFPCAPLSWLVWWLCLINPLCFAFNSSPCAAEWHK